MNSHQRRVYRRAVARGDALTGFQEFILRRLRVTNRRIFFEFPRHCGKTQFYKLVAEIEAAERYRGESYAKHLQNAFRNRYPEICSLWAQLAAEGRTVTGRLETLPRPHSIKL